MYSNGQQTNSQAQSSEWLAPRQVKIVRWSKVRTDSKTGKASRGVLIKDDEADIERWVSLPTNSQIFYERQWNTYCYYYGEHTSPSIGIKPISAKTPDAREFINQSKADYYARIAEQNKKDIEPEPIRYDNNEAADDRLIESLSYTMSKCVSMAQALNPQLDADNQTKIAISVFIQLAKQKEQMPY